MVKHAYMTRHCSPEQSRPAQPRAQARTLGAAIEGSAGGEAPRRWRHGRQAPSLIRRCPLAAAPPRCRERPGRAGPGGHRGWTGKTGPGQKQPGLNWQSGEKPISLPPYCLQYDEHVNLSHKLLPPFHLLLCQNRTAFWSRKLKSITLDLASDRANEANTYLLLIDGEIGYWKVPMIKCEVGRFGAGIQVCCMAPWSIHYVTALHHFHLANGDKNEIILSQGKFCQSNYPRHFIRVICQGQESFEKSKEQKLI